MRSPDTATKSSPHSPQLEKARAQQWRPNAARNENKQTERLDAVKRYEVFLKKLAYEQVDMTNISFKASKF